MCCATPAASPRQPRAVAVLSDAGYRQLRRHGHARVATACAPALPADVRFIDPQHADGLAGAGADRCLALFEAPWPELPVVLEREAGAAGARLVLRVPPDLRTLRGHFSALPIVPGVVHLAWVLHFAHGELGVSSSLAGMDQVKFRRIVQPGHRLTLSITPDPARGSLSFRLGTQDELFSAGRLFLDRGRG